MNQDFKNWIKQLPASERMPLLFIGHGNPMNAIMDNEYRRSWQELGNSLVTPQAILCISAHWLTRGTAVTAMTNPKTIHDFGGFPKELFEQQYPASGDPDLGNRIQQMSKSHQVSVDFDWGLDHGAWSVLKPMFPLANVPVVQLSIDYYQPIQYHYELAKELKQLREKGVLIVGSGNLVHNLGQMSAAGKVYDWALEFDQQLAKMIKQGNDNEAMNFQKWGELSSLAHPTFDHLLPLFYVLGMKYADEQARFFNETFDLGSVSMRSIVYAKE
jgi:4,5-DOPA dioxygenase extradiol